MLGSDLISHVKTDYSNCPQRGIVMYIWPNEAVASTAIVVVNHWSYRFTHGVVTNTPQMKMQSHTP